MLECKVGHVRWFSCVCVLQTQMPDTHVRPAHTNPPAPSLALLVLLLLVVVVVVLLLLGAARCRCCWASYAAKAEAVGACGGEKGGEEDGGACGTGGERDGGRSEGGTT